MLAVALIRADRFRVAAIDPPYFKICTTVFRSQWRGQGRRLITDSPRRVVLRSGKPHADGGGSGGDSDLERAGQEHSRNRADARGVAQHGALLMRELRGQKIERLHR